MLTLVGMVDGHGERRWAWWMSVEGGHGLILTLLDKGAYDTTPKVPKLCSAAPWFAAAGLQLCHETSNNFY